MQAKKYYRILLGRKHVYAAECRQGNFVGVGFGIHQDLTKELPEDFREFNKKFRPIHQEKFPEKTKIAAGQACGAIWTVSKGMKQGDVVLCPDGNAGYLIGEVVGDYHYQAGEILPHRRSVRWHEQPIERASLSQEFRNATVSGTIRGATPYADEIEALLSGSKPAGLVPDGESIEDPTGFVLEKHLEEFLVKNWTRTEFGSAYDIVEVDGDLIGQQYPTDTGPIDILAVSKDKKELLVVELKRGRASDVVVGQIQRYMGFVLEDLAEKDQTVRGVIIALEDDLKIRRALAVTTNIEFYRYQISFKLFKV